MDELFFYVFEDHATRREPDGHVRGPHIIGRVNFQSYVRLHNHLMTGGLYARIAERDLFGHEIITYKRVRR